MKQFDCKSLRKWFLADQRDLPWRQNPSPYEVWVSEVMLQQTQVAVVIPYFQRWMRQFPTIKSLADADLDSVIKAWEGLGYYSRARNLHAGARQVMEQFGGSLPEDEHNLKKIKGLGPYTIGAIQAFAFHRRAAAVDGNVLRVLSRYDMIEEDLSKPSTVKSIRERALQLLPEEEPWVISEALIELGATVCGRRPRCSECPLKKSCQAFAAGKAGTLPIKGGKVKTLMLYRAVVVAVAEGRCLVRRGERGKVMHDLHEFPYIETGVDGISVKELEQRIGSEWNLDVLSNLELEKVRHGFTRYDVRLSPVLFHVRGVSSVSGYEWKTFEELDQLAFSSGHRRIYQSLTPHLQVPGV